MGTGGEPRPRTREVRFGESVPNPAARRIKSRSTPSIQSNAAATRTVGRAGCAFVQTRARSGAGFSTSFAGRRAAGVISALPPPGTSRRAGVVRRVLVQIRRPPCCGCAFDVQIHQPDPGSGSASGEARPSVTGHPRTRRGSPQERHTGRTQSSESLVSVAGRSIPRANVARPRPRPSAQSTQEDRKWTTAPRAVGI